MILTRIGVDPSWTQSYRLDALRGQFNGVLGGEHIEASLADRVSQQGRKASDASKLNISTRTGNEGDLLLFAVTNEIEERVDDEDIADHICPDLCAVSWGCFVKGLVGGSYILIDLILQRLLLAMATFC